MKKTLIIAWLLLTISVHKLKGQDTLAFLSFEQAMEHVYGALDPINIPSGILLNKAPGETKLIHHTGSYSDSMALYEDWLLMCNRFYYGAPQLNQKLNFYRVDSIARAYFDTTSYIPVGLLNFTYEVLEDSAIFENLIYADANHRLHDQVNRPRSPYHTHRLFSVMPTQFLTVGSVLTYMLDTAFMFSNHPTALVQAEADFDDGNGFQLFSPGTPVTVDFDSSGVYKFRFKFTYTDSVFYCNTFVRVGVPDLNARNQNYTSPDEVRSISSYSNTLNHENIGKTTVEGEYAIWYSPCNTEKKLRKPFIISAGFNPGNGKRFYPGLINWEEVTINIPISLIGVITVTAPLNPSFNGEWRGTYYETYNGNYLNAFRPETGIGSIPAGFENGDDNDNHFLDRLRNEGFDIVIVRYNDGVDLIENNAHAFIEVVKTVNNELLQNGSKHEIVVAGFSAGAFTTRYALALMEKEHSFFLNTPLESSYPHHRCRVWLSVECEAQGANTPLSMQYYNNFRQYKIPFNSIDIIDKVSAIVAQNFVNSPASRELSKYYYQAGNSFYNFGTMDTAYQDQLRTDMVARFTSLNTLPGGAIHGYPLWCRKVGLAQGSGIGNTTVSPDGYALQPGTEVFDVRNRTGVHTMTLTTDMKAYWLNHGSSYVFKGTQGIQFMILPLHITWPTPYTPYHPFSNYQNGRIYAANAKGYDHCPGSYQAATDQTFNADLQRFYLNLLWVINGSRYKYNQTPTNPLTNPFGYQKSLHSFCPTVSALDLHDPKLPGHPEVDLFRTPDQLNLLYINDFINSTSGFGNKSEFLEYGFPYIKNPINHYIITPYDAVWNVGNRHIVQNTGLPPNHFHVEDSQPEMGQFMYDEVAPDTLRLQNRTIGATENYYAWFESRTQIISGDSIFQRTEQWREPVGKFVVEHYGDVTFEAAHEIALLPGFEVVLDGEFGARIANNYCVPVFSGNRHHGSPQTLHITAGITPRPKSAVKDSSNDVTGLTVWPNPVIEPVIYYKLPFAPAPSSLYSIILTDAAGNKVLRQDCLSTETSINLPVLSPGVYLLQLIYNHETYQQKILVQ
jgi:hypothetical protein